MRDHASMAWSVVTGHRIICDVCCRLSMSWAWTGARHPQVSGSFSLLTISHAFYSDLA